MSDLDPTTRATLDDLRRRERDYVPITALPRIAADVAENRPDDTSEALRLCLASAWGALEIARRNAFNGVWSIDCENQVETIMMLTHFTGPISWRQVQVRLILDGLYEAIHEACGHPTPLTDAERDRAREVLARSTP